VIDMSERRPPILDSLVLCSYVEYDGNQRPFRLVEPLHTVVVTPIDDKLLAPEFVLFAQFNDEEANGTYDLSVEVRSETNIVIQPAEAVERVTFFSRYHPPEPMERAYMIRDLVFPGPGVYHFHVMCGLASLSDRENAVKPAKLRVIRAEGGGT
jgi:hypothetical protein